MENAIEKVLEFFLSQGLSGMVIVGLGFAVYKLYNRNLELTETLIEGGQANVKTNEQVAASLNRLSDLLLYSGRER